MPYLLLVDELNATQFEALWFFLWWDALEDGCKVGERVWGPPTIVCGSKHAFINGNGIVVVVESFEEFSC